MILVEQIALDKLVVELMLERFDDLVMLLVSNLSNLNLQL
jgi:hypothetical protein